MQERKVILTWEAIYDIADAEIMRIMNIHIQIHRIKCEVSRKNT